MAVELFLVLFALIGVILVYYFLKTIKHLIVNTILGLLLLALSNLVFKVGIVYSIPVILVCALGGIPGALLVILLHVLGIAF